MRESRRSYCPISSALDLLGDRWSLLVMRDVLLRGKSHYREFLASEEWRSSPRRSDQLFAAVISRAGRRDVARGG